MDPIDILAQGKMKRFFRSKRKLIHSHIVSHITQRAAGKEPSFLENDDYLRMLGLLKEISGKYALTVLSFCLMPNHVHLLLRTGDKNFGSVVNRRPGIMLSNPLPVYHFMHQTRCSNKRGEPG